MDVKLAVSTAKEYVASLFANEGVEHLGLEEVEFDDSEKAWIVTVGFSRPWDRVRAPNAMTALMNPMALPRSYKIVRIDDKAGQVVSVKNHERKS